MEIVVILNLAACFLIAGVCLPLARRKISKNDWYGFRLPKSDVSDDLWYEINTYCARRCIIWCGIISVVNLLMLLLPSRDLTSILLVSTVPVSLLAIPIIQTVLYARNLPDDFRAGEPSAPE